MTIGIQSLIDAVTSHASASGHFARVQNHEPKSMPPNGPGPDLFFMVIVSNIGPARSGSGLVSTTARVELSARIYMPFRTEPEDLIDSRLTEALDDLFEAYTGDFELGGAARNIDVLGSQGQPLSARAGYSAVDGATFRVADITIPIIVNDAWTQEA